jgi:DNA-binding HxlR family transcriptional regulator
MRTYGQYCPIARGAEIFAERWTPLIVRNLYLGCETFGEILEGAPGLSHTMLTQRLKQLERLGIVESAPKAHGRGHRYQLTSSGHDLFKVCETLGEWGARWLEIAPENLDPYVALWSMCNALRRDRLPDQRVVIRLDFTGFRPHERYWLLLEHREAEICKTYPGLDEDLYITADAEAFVKWHAGQLSWAEATWAWPALTDIPHQGHRPGEDVHHGHHGTQATSGAPVVHARVQGRDRRAVPRR